MKPTLEPGIEHELEFSRPGVQDRPGLLPGEVLGKLLPGAK